MLDTSLVIELGREALWVAILIAGPLLGVALIVGLIIGIIQAATSINEMTLSFIPPKIAALVAVLIFVGSWQISVIVDFTRKLYERIPTLFLGWPMELFVADLIERFYTALWPFLRIGAMLLAVPVLSIDAVSVRIRVLLTLALTLMIYPLVDWPTIDPVSAEGLAEIVNQILIGVLMGFFLQIVTAAVVVGGQAIANAMGLSMATMVDPGLGTVPLMSQFLLILATLIFLSVGGHMLVIGILLRSFETFPVGVAFIGEANFGALIEWSAMIFLGGVLLALPVMVALLLVNIGVGVITRAAPSLNIFAVGFPVFFLTGYTVLILSMAGIGARIQWLWMAGIERVKDFVLVPGVI